jgi:hypothetical protein
MPIRTKGKIILVVLHTLMFKFLEKGRDRSVGTVTGCGLDYRGSGVRFPVRTGNFSLHHRVQTGPGAHSASYQMGTRCSFPGGKAAGVVELTTHLHLVPRLKNEWSCTSTPPICLYGAVLS